MNFISIFSISYQPSIVWFNSVWEQAHNGDDFSYLERLFFFVHEILGLELNFGGFVKLVNGSLMRNVVLFTMTVFIMLIKHVSVVSQIFLDSVHLSCGTESPFCGCIWFWRGCDAHLPRLESRFVGLVSRGK